MTEEFVLPDFGETGSTSPLIEEILANSRSKSKKNKSKSGKSKSNKSGGKAKSIREAEIEALKELVEGDLLEEDKPKLTRSLSKSAKTVSRRLKSIQEKRAEKFKEVEDVFGLRAAVSRVDACGKMQKLSKAEAELLHVHDCDSSSDEDSDNEADLLIGDALKNAEEDLSEKSVTISGMGFKLGPLSNYWLSRKPLIVDGEVYRSVEHYYQFQKYFQNPYQTKATFEYAKLIRAQPQASFARILGDMDLAQAKKDKLDNLAEQIIQAQKVFNVFPDPQWKWKKDAIMYKALWAKFSSSPLLARLLLTTGDKTLFARTGPDPYWGAGHDGLGVNRLFTILRTIRRRLRNELRTQTLSFKKFALHKNEFLNTESFKQFLQDVRSGNSLVTFA